jgi:formylmethanofuran dehydrogenase subunit D
VIKLKITLITGRTLKQGIMVEGNKLKMDDELSIGEMNPKDMDELKVKDNERVILSHGQNKIIIRAKINPDIPRGLIFSPITPQINKLIPYIKSRRGILSGKGILIDIVKES